ncbi:hypothetical protein P879_07285 [Paragonimus westermani]|uniref:Uncharacterized protein n=1 Tax=Paragonimus westermani TaxID=34504 RepID=A0A8T0DL54_9TREM|nr:hypothetical protein P879_07285 [Paragonimus westermani]
MSPLNSLEICLLVLSFFPSSMNLCGTILFYLHCSCRRLFFSSGLTSLFNVCDLCLEHAMRFPTRSHAFFDVCIKGKNK